MFTNNCVFCRLFSADSSAYVEYSSSEEEEQVSRKPSKRRRDDSDSGSDVRNQILHAQVTYMFNLIYRLYCSTIHLVALAIQMLAEKVHDPRQEVVQLQADEVLDASQQKAKRKKHLPHQMNLAMSQKKRHRLPPDVVEDDQQEEKKLQTLNLRRNLMWKVKRV